MKGCRKKRLFYAIGEKHFAECDGTHLRSDYRDGQSDMVKALSEAGADPNLPSTMSHTPLMEAGATPEHKNTFESTAENANL